MCVAMASMSIATGAADGCDYRITLQGTGGTVRLPPAWLHTACSLGLREFQITGAGCTTATYDVSRAVLATVDGQASPAHDILQLDLRSTSPDMPSVIYASASRGAALTTTHSDSPLHRIELGPRRVEMVPPGGAGIAGQFYGK